MFGMCEGFDIGFEMSGVVFVFFVMIDNMNYGGCIVMLGLLSVGFGIDWGKFVMYMFMIKGIYGWEMFEMWNVMGVML